MLVKLVRVESGIGVTLSVIFDREWLLFGPAYRNEPDSLAWPRQHEVIKHLEDLVESLGRKWAPVQGHPSVTVTELELLEEDIATVRRFGRHGDPRLAAVVAIRH